MMILCYAYAPPLLPFLGPLITKIKRFTSFDTEKKRPSERSKLKTKQKTKKKPKRKHILKRSLWKKIKEG